MSSTNLPTLLWHQFLLFIRWLADMRALVAKRYIQPMYESTCHVARPTRLYVDGSPAKGIK